MLADTPSEKKPLSGWYFTQTCWRIPTPIAPTKASGRLVIRPITTATNEPTSSSVNWNSARLTTGAKSTPANPASPMPIIHDTAVTPSVLTPCDRRVPGVVDRHAGCEAEGGESEEQRRRDRDGSGADDDDELVAVHVGAEHLDELGVRRVLHQAVGLEDLPFGDEREDDLHDGRQRDPQAHGGDEPHRRRCVGELLEQEPVEEQPEQRGDDEDRERRRDRDRQLGPCSYSWSQ